MTRWPLVRPLPIPILLAASAALLGACAGDAGDSGSGASMDTAAATDTAGPAPSPDTGTVTVSDAGLETPESVLYDAASGVYLVSNINGAATEKDDNGFISRVRPDGTVEELRWIDAAASEEVTLNAPKGLAIKGDTLFVADIDSVRAFDHATGAPLGARGVPGATFLNDLAVGPDGTLYVSDSGLSPDFSSSGTDAIYRFEGERAVPVAEGADLGRPNGILVDGDALLAVTYGAAEVKRIPLNGDSVSVVATLPGGQLDGLVRLDDGSLLVSSWETRRVYRIPAGGGGAVVVVEGVPSPADIGWDPQRRRVLVPIFTESRLEFHALR